MHLVASIMLGLSIGGLVMPVNWELLSAAD
jgi:hypothetical protein